jgi:hypothetical protein
MAGEVIANVPLKFPCSPLVVLIARLTSVVDPDRARLRAIGERRQKISQLRVAAVRSDELLTLKRPNRPHRLQAISSVAARMSDRIIEPSRGIADRSLPADYIRAMPTIDLPDDELAAVTAAIRRTIEDDKYPHAPRLDPLRSALVKLDPPALRRSSQ